MTEKKTIVYLHRYPIEDEHHIYPAVRGIFDELQLRYRVVYVSFQAATRIDQELRKGLVIRELPYTVDRTRTGDKWRKMLLWFANINRIRKIIREENAACIIHKEQLPIMPYVLSSMRIPLLLDIGDWWWSTLLGGSRLGLWIAETIENIETGLWGSKDNVFVSAHSHAEAKVITDRGMAPKRIRVINHPSSNGVYLPIDVSARRKTLCLDGAFVVALHGIIHPSKGYNQILEWWVDLSKRHRHWKLLIVGGTIGEAWCRNTIQRLNIEHSTIMTGWVRDTAELNEYLNLADCLLVTRRNDVANRGLIPSSLFHSLSIGKPLLVTGLPGLSEMVRDGIDAFIFEPDNYESFRNKLEYIAAHPAEALRVATAGITRGQDVFDPKKCITGFCQFIDDIVANHH